MSVYAVVESGGKQYRVSEGQIIDVEKLSCEVGQEVELDRVLLVAKEGDVQVGRPTVEGASVVGTVVEQPRGRKIVVFKYKPKQRYRRKTGHRQQYTRLRIDKIIS
jgi:large subunit ribosomal protein L21